MLRDIDQFKKNPAIKFDYSYFVDREPTKYVGTQRGNNVPVKPQPVPETEPDDSDDAKKKALAIAGGIAAGLAVLTLVIVILVSLTGRVELPNFVGLNYNEEIVGNEEYADFKFETQNVNDETQELGTVLEQSPEKGAKVRKHSTVILKIAYNDDNVLIEPVIGKTVDDANQILTEKGFQVSVVEVYDKLQTPGLVFKTFPEENTYAERGSTVTLYVSTDETDNMVKVPAVVGDSADLAKELIEKVGLVCKIEEVNDAENKGMVTSQSPDGDSLLEIGSTVTIKVSNGIPESSTATVSYSLPKGMGDSGTIKYYLNDTLYKSEKNILFSGKTKSIEVKGSGEDNTFVVTANDKKIYECKIDFTSVPGVVSDEKDFPYTDDIPLPDLTDKVKAEAESALKTAGFTNYTFVNESSDTVEEGRVIKTDPAGGATAKYSPDKKITVYISSGPEQASEEPSSEATTD
jgi:serine/threonine-protein kinase